PMNILQAAQKSANDRLEVQLGDVVLRLTGKSATELTSSAGREVLLGIRPEDLYETAPAAIAARVAPLAVRVAAVEPLGAETLLLLTLGETAQELTARVGRETKLRPGDRAAIALDTGAIKLFDPVTNRAIGGYALSASS